MYSANPSKKLEGDLSCSNRLSKGVQTLLRLHTTSLAIIDYNTGFVSTTNSFMFFYLDIIIAFFFFSLHVHNDIYIDTDF